MKDKKNIKGKEKKGELKFLLCRSLVMVPTCAQQQQNKKKKKRNSSAPFTKTWQWHRWYPKAT
jgi:hypothetical protein